jgi:dUTP pyrophosphatase
MSTHTFPVDLVLLPNYPANTPPPAYATPGSAGCDLVAAIPEPIEIGASPVLIPTGISVAVPAGFEAQVRPRSGMALKHGVIVVNAPGTIDSDYRGEIKVIMYVLPRVHNRQISDNAFSNVIVPYATTIKPGDRIAQLVFAPCWRALWSVRSALDATERGDGGFGSTGAK